MVGLIPLPPKLPSVSRVTPVPVRYYQEEARVAVASSYESGRRKVVIEMPTGAGKTYFLWHILQWFYQGGWYDARALIVLPSIELVRQTYKSARAFFPEGMLGVVQAEQNTLGRPITIASVDTLALPGRMYEVVQSAGGPNRFTFIAIDEAHVSLSGSYCRLLEVLEHPYALRVGVTATPFRQDGRSLLRVFPDGLAYYVDLLDLIAQGYLVRPIPYAVETDLDLEGIDLSLLEQSDEGSDDAPTLSDRLIDRMTATNRYALAYTAWQHIIGGERTILFADSVKDAYAFHDHFVERGAPCEIVTGMMSDGRRQDIYSRFHEGETRLICSCGVLTTGVDFIRVMGLIIARSSLFGEHPNRGLHNQILGRGLRLSDERDEWGLPKKRECKVVYLIPSQKKGARPPIVMSLGILPGTLEDPPRTMTSPKEEVSQEGLLETDDPLAEEALIELSPPPEEVILHLKSMQASAIDVFAGSGWKKHPEGSFSRQTEMGTLIAERAGLEHLYQVYLRYPSGLTRCIVPEPCDARDARARGTHYVARKLEEQKMRRGEESTEARTPATPGQLKMLQQRRVPVKGPKMPTQGDVWRIVAHLDAHGGNFRKGVEAIGWANGRVYTMNHEKRKDSIHEKTNQKAE